jgi:hypothetical protein
MPNLLSLRASPDAALVRFDVTFFQTQLVPLLRRRGFGGSASAEGPADLWFALEPAALEELLGGRSRILPGRIRASAGVWRALVRLGDGRAQTGAARAREVGASDGWSGERAAVGSDRARGPGGRRVKGRRRAAMSAGPLLATPPPAALAPGPVPAADPASFALAQLLRLAAAVVVLIDGSGVVAEDAEVVIEDGVVVVGGRRQGPVWPSSAQDRPDGP